MEQLSIDFDAPQVPHGVMNRNDVYFAGRSEHKGVRGQVLAWLRTNGPATREQIAVGMHRPLSSICGRVNELMAHGDVIETSERRITSAGKTAVVVRAAS